jgi:hypothetical protein
MLFQKCCGIFAQGKNCGARETAVVANGSEITFVSMQRPGKQLPAATVKHATIEVLLEAVFYTRSVQGGYKKNN